MRIISEPSIYILGSIFLLHNVKTWSIDQVDHYYRQHENILVDSNRMESSFEKSHYMWQQLVNSFCIFSTFSSWKMCKSYGNGNSLHICSFWQMTSAQCWFQQLWTSLKDLISCSWWDQQMNQDGHFPPSSTTRQQQQTYNHGGLWHGRLTSHLMVIMWNVE